METTEVTSRTKAAVRTWADLGDDAPILLDDLLDSLRKNSLNDLRVRVNEQFSGESNFPISSEEWQTFDLKSVRNVRDQAKKRL